MKAVFPETDSIRELAEFWDTHELTEFEDQLEEMTEPVFVRQATTVKVPLSQDEHRAIQQMAASRGVEEAALIREWVQEKLQQS